MLIVATVAFVLALSMLFVHDLAGVPMAEHGRLWPAAALLVLAALAALAARTRAAKCAGLWAAIALAMGAFALFHLPSRDAGQTQGWRRDAGQRLARTLAAVGEEVARLESVSSGLAAEVQRRVGATAGHSLSPEDRTAAFALLDSLAQATSRSKSLTVGTAIGLQLFDTHGRRIAWAGWPQAVSSLDRMFLASGTELVYTREVSLYHILSHVVPCSTAAGERTATLLVDIPLEVDYRVNNRFLKSASLADEIPRDVAARVTFDYFPPTGNLPERLERLRAQQSEAKSRRERMITSARSQPRAPATGADSTRAAPTWQDSVLTYFAFPSNTEAVGEVGGDEVSGLQGAVLIRSRGGNPLLRVSATSEPFAHVVETRALRRSVWGKSFALMALIALFAQAAAWLHPRRGRGMTVARAALYAAFMVALRYGLLAFAPSARWLHATVFDPSVFATPALGGLMRSAFDLVLTAVFFVATLYGLVRIARGSLDAARTGRAPGRWWLAAGSVAVAVVNLTVFELARRFTSTVVVNANPRLVGETMAVTDVGVVALQVGIFLMITGLLLAGMFALWGLFRVVNERRPAAVVSIGWLLVLGACAIEHRWEPAVLSAMVMLFVGFAPRITHRENLVSVGIAAFCLVIASSATAYVYLSQDYDELRKGFVLEKSNEVTNPSDNWKVVILEDLLGDYAQRPEIRQAIRNPSSQDIERLAFDLWAESPLSLLGYSCAIHVVNADDSGISEFSVDMPYRVRIDEGGERTDTPDRNQWAVLDLTRSTPQGVVRFYRGILNVDEGELYEGAQTPPRLLGKVIVDVPFFFESLALAARTGPRTPEVLRNVQEGGVAPRVEEPEALLLARVDRDRRVIESSSERLAVGTPVAPSIIQRALAQKWPVLKSGGRSYRVTAVSTPGETTLLAGFLVPSHARYLLRWSTLLSLYLFFAIVLLAAVIALATVPRLSAALPTITPKRLGFQQKLLASFLIVALVPAVILGVFSVNFIKGRFLEESRTEASDKASSARKAFVNLLHGEQQFFLGRTDLAQLFVPKTPAVHDLGGGRIVMLFDDSAMQDEAPGVPVAGSVTDVSTEDLVVADVGGKQYIGVFSAPLKVAGASWIGSYYVYYARAIDVDLLGEIAEQVGADVNVYADGQLVASSREGLLAGGFISSSMNSDAFVEVSMLGSDRMLATERAGSYDFQVAYLPIDRWVRADSAAVSAGAATAPAWVPATTRAAMGVPLLFRPESYSLEVQRATFVVLGVFALLLAATIALGLVVARGVFEPLRGLVAGTQRVSRGDFGVRLPERRSDEIGLVVSAFNEMTEKIAESQRTLEERRRYLEAILENIGAGVVSTDAAGRVLTVNAAAERIIGAPSAALLGRTAHELAAGDRAPAVFALFAPGDGPPLAFTSGELEVQGPERRATVKYMRTHLEAEGRRFGTVLVFEDVTELIESKKLSAWVEMARQIAHEIKNPLTPIRISTQFMRRAYEQKPGEFDRAFREGTDTILQQVEVLKRIAGEFSSYGRMQHLHLRAHPVDPLVRRILTPYEHGATVRVRYENGAADATVMADAEAVRKICTNLIENAIEAMGEKGAELRVHCAEGTEEGVSVVRIVFRDSGPGLSDDVERRLFEPYFSTKTTGTGLGLAICRTLSREMGGDVTVRNAADGRGTEATLTLRRGHA